MFMNLTRFVQNLQEKPEPTKHFILWTATTLIMVLIVSGWIFSLSSKMKTVSLTPQPQREQPTGLGSLWDSIKSDFASLKEIIPEDFFKKEKKEPSPPQNQKSQSEDTLIPARKLPLSD